MPKIFPAKFIFALGTAIALLAATAGAAPPFVTPTEVNPPFRRDRLPIDTDSMSSLSRNLERLSQSASLDDASHRRAAAQSLALALALDPTNSSARDTLSALADGETLRSDSEKLTRAKANIWQIYGWLATPEAGTDGKLLADLMGDATAKLDPEHPSAATLRDSGELGNWSGWVAPLSEFEKTEPVLVERPPQEPQKSPEPPPSKQPARIALKEASVKTVLFAYDKKEEKSRFGRTVASMKAWTEDRREEGEAWWRPAGLWVDVPCREGYEGDVRDFVANPILRALEAADVPMPKNGRIMIRASDDDTYSFRANTNAISGTGFLLAHAALTGSVPDATVIGVIDSKGNIAPPTYLWYYISELREGEGGRLVVPAAAEEYFIALLTLEEPDFFLKYEVFTASTPKEFAELCAKNPGEKQVSVSKKFQEIRDKATPSSLGPYLANRFVRQRLLEIHSEMPQHLSAKMLALQGSPERPPRTLQKKILASVIWRDIAPIDSAIDIDIYSFGSDRVASMEKIHDELREALTSLDRLTERSDTELLTRAKAVNSDLRALSRALNSRSDDWNRKYSAISKAYDAVKESNRNLRNELSVITGDPLPNNVLEFIRNQRDRFQNH